MAEAHTAPLLQKLLDRMDGTENLEFEAKLAQGGLPQDLWPSVSAFANTQGGWIVLGAREISGSLVFEGVKSGDALLKTFHDLLRNQQKISAEVCGPNDTSVLSNDAGQEIVVIRVPEAGRKLRPVYVGGNPYTGTYLRRSSGDYRCNKPEVDRMMREASDVSADSTVLAHFGLDDLDPETVAAFRRAYQTSNPSSPFNTHDDPAFLSAVGTYRRDRVAGTEGLTVAGLLFLGKTDALREWRSRHLIDYRRVITQSDVQDWEDRVAWEGNLFDAFETLYPRLTEGHSVPFRLEHGRRVSEGPAHVALREALVNLLVHADYSETQASLILRSPEGYMFRNPGSSRVSEDDLLTGNRSDPRNPELARMFRFVGLAEEAGTGIPRIIQQWRELGFQLPGIDVGTERYEFTLNLRHAHFLEEEDRTWLGGIGHGWSEAEQLALVGARHEGSIDNLTVRRLTGQHPADVTQLLGNLRDRGFLRMVGAGRGARYELGQSATSLATPVVSPADNEATFVDNEVSLVDSEPSLEGYQAVFPAFSPELQDIAQAARTKKRLAPDSLGEIIVRLCTTTPLTVKELANLLDRREAYVGQVVRTLTRAGHVAFLFPDAPSHPEQRYTTRTR